MVIAVGLSHRRFFAWDSLSPPPHRWRAANVASSCSKRKENFRKIYIMQLKHGKADIQSILMFLCQDTCERHRVWGLVSINKLHWVGLSHHFPVALFLMHFSLIFVVVLAIFYFIINLQHTHLCQCVYHSCKNGLTFYTICSLLLFLKYSASACYIPLSP